MTDKTQAETLRQEYRATMPADVLHLWAKDAIACIVELEARCAHIEADTLKIIEQRNELAAQLSAIGAGGVESLRKREQKEFAEVVAMMTAIGFGVEPADAEAALPSILQACAATEACAALQAAPPAPAGVAVPEALRELIEAIEFTPLGVRAIQAMTRARAALAATPAQAVAVDYEKELTHAALRNYDLRMEKEALVAALQEQAQEHATQLAGQGQELAREGTLRFDLGPDDWFKGETGPYPLYYCLDCNAYDYGPTRITHKDGCRVAAAIAARAAQGGAA